jgi:pectinesterase
MRSAFVIAVVLLAGAACLAQTTAPSAGGAVVAQDGSGQFKTVQDAINASPQTASAAHPWTIHIKPGTYKELIYIQREKRFVRLVGEDPEKTIITYDLGASKIGLDGRPIGTFRTPTVYVDADLISFENITFENSFGRGSQALAIRIDGDRVSFRNCRFLGFQDTILGNRGRHYFENCYIVGATDFIFGGATEFYENCHIHVVASGYITAASTPQEQRFGLIFNHCTITGEPGVRTFLGRPWRDFAMTLFMNTEMSEVVRPEGWNNWNNPPREKTSRYLEYKNTGPGAATEGRVGWSRQLSDAEAAEITATSVLAGPDGWSATAPP